MNAIRTKENPQGPWKVASDFHVPEGFFDSSWDQDLNPSVTCEVTGRMILWDTEECANIAAEFGCDGDFLRFFVTDGEGRELYSGNDMERAISTARDESQSHSLASGN